MKTKPAILGGKPVRKDFLVFGAPVISNDGISEVVETLKSGWLSTGPRTRMFEDMFRKYIGTKYAVGLNSCTAGLHLALIVAGIGRSDEVITSPFTFPSTVNVIIHQGAKPVFVDIDKTTMTVDPLKIIRKVTRRTRAIIPVHFGGYPCDMDAILKIARKNNLWVISDAAHAIETEYKGKKVGALGDIASFSFYATKNLTTGEGGMVTTPHRKWAEKIAILRLHGISKDAWKRYSARGSQHYETIFPGYKYNMTDIQAALGIHQLKKLDGNWKIRKKYVSMYNEAFRSSREIIIPSLQEEQIRHAHHLYVIMLRKELLNIGRGHFTKALKAENIGTGVHFIAVHLHSYYRNRFGFEEGDYPNAEYASDRVISLPLSAGLTEKDVRDVIKAVYKTVEYYRK